MAEGGERVSRPSSLLLEATPPEREPLRFDVQLVGAPPEVEQLVNNIKQVAEDFLYHWKTFPIILPPSRFTETGNRPSDIIVAPPCDELDAAALDAGLEPHPLSPKQLHAIREKGEFEVPSRHFPGQTHVWRVAPWLQRGRERAREDLYCHVARATALVVVVARDRLVRDQPLSAIAGAKALLAGLHRLLDLAVGMPSLEARDLEKKIREERSRYLVAELICKPEHQEDIAALAAWVTRAMRRAASEKTDARETPRNAPRVPCIYTTPQRTTVDLRLYRRDILRRAAPSLQAILDRESRGWFLHFRERRAALLASQKMPMKDIEEEVKTAAMREYVTRVCNAVMSCEQLHALGPDIPALLAAQLKAASIVNRAEEGVRRKLEAGLATAEARICATHPILSRADTWRKEKLGIAAQRSDLIVWRRNYLLRIKAYRKLNKQIYYTYETRSNEGHTSSYVWMDNDIESSRQAFLNGLSRGLKNPNEGRRLIVTHIGSNEGFLEDGELIFQAKKTDAENNYHGEMDAHNFEKWLKNELRWAPMEDAASAMQAHKLHQHRYFLLRDLTFLRDREPLLMKELRAAKTPTREFTWATRIWLPQQWTVVRHFRGRSERIPTVLSSRATSIVTPRSDPSQPVFLVDKERIRTSSTRWPGWRLLNTAHRTWCWSWNMMFLLGVLIPWCSPFSLRTLLSVKPFVPDYELSQVNGTLFPKRSSETQTMWSRLLTLWRHVSKERTRFETEPDTGLLGKGLSRQANRMWNYGVVGGLGSVTLLLLFPIVAVVCSVVSLLAAATVPLWMPALTAAVHAANALVYDLDCPQPNTINRFFVLFEVVIWQIGILGILQPITAFIVAVIICPLCAFILLVGGVLWWGCRGVWEEISWRCIITRAARVPAHDSAFCRRLTGPGLHTRAYYQITSGQALAAVCARGELESLASWASEIELAIERPLRDYAHFVDACFGPFSVQIAKTGAYKQLEKECSELTASLREKVSTRRRELALGLSDCARARVRMVSHDLRRAIQASASELSRLWSLAARSEEWWAARGLDPGDWHGLAANMLVEVFDTEVLVALEESEARLPLESGEGARVWTARCGRDAEPPDVLAERDDWRRDTAGSWGEWCGAAAPRVPAPALDGAAFSPRAAPHPPVPHPALVALVLHNRESDNPVPLDSELCAEILRSLEDAPDCDDRRAEYVERYRGGGSEEGTSEATSEGSPDDEDARSHDTRASVEPERPHSALCRVSPVRERAACRWTLTGRGVRLRADLASPEDVTLDAERAHVGTSV